MEDAKLYGLIAIVTAAIAFIILEKIYPYNPGQKTLREGFWLDMIGYNVFQNFVLGIIIAYVIEWIDLHAGWSRLQLITDWPIALQVCFFIVTHDLYIYLFHRWQHRNKYLWRLHEAHHSVKDVDWLSGVRSHPLEIFINQTIEFAPMVFLGAPPEVAVYKGAIGAIWGMYIHSNVDVRMGWLQYVINGPEMHRWHHSISEDEAMNSNFSTKFSIFDWAFGTAFFPDRKTRKADDYGLFLAVFPRTYIGQILFAFRSFRNRRG